MLLKKTIKFCLFILDPHIAKLNLQLLCTEGNNRRILRSQNHRGNAMLSQKLDSFSVTCIEFFPLMTLIIVIHATICQCPIYVNDKEIDRFLLQASPLLHIDKSTYLKIPLQAVVNIHCSIVSHPLPSLHPYAHDHPQRCKN